MARAPKMPPMMAPSAGAPPVPPPGVATGIPGAKPLLRVAIGVVPKGAKKAPTKKAKAKGKK